jgi:outer membrane receptor protein involved in Fe transport
MRLLTIARATASPIVLASALLVGASGAYAQSAASPGPAGGADPSTHAAQSPNSTSVGAAQGATSPASAAPIAPALSPSDQPTTVDEIVVTAQKRTQSLQDVPIVVTAVSRQLMQDTGVRDIKDLAVLVPGLTVTSTTSETSTSARIRGIGTVGDNPGLESSVGVVIDGVYRPRNGVGFGDLGDVDRIEVLKGPQGTLFGKSTSAGVINILTAEPSFKPGAEAEFTAGNYGAYGGAASVTGPIFGDKVAGSLYFADRQRGGFYDVNTGQGPRTATEDNTRDFYTIRGQLLILPNEQTSVRIIADYSHRDELCCAAVLFRDGETAPIVGALGGPGGGEPQTPNPFNRIASENRTDTQNTYDEGISAQLDYKLPSINATITSISAFRDFKSLSAGDLDYTNADLFYKPDTNANSEQFIDWSEELRFAGTYGKLDYLVGGFYANESLRNNFSLLYGSQFTDYLSLLFTGGASPNFLQGTFGSNFAPNEGSVDRYRQRDNTYAVFTNETLHVTSKFDLNVGVRYTIDNKVENTVSYNSDNGGGCAPVNGAYNALGTPAALAVVNATTCLPFESPAYNNFTDHQDETERAVSGTAKASYRFNSEVLTYASYARGYKAGGFNLDRVACPSDNTPYCAANPGSLTPNKDTEFPGEFADSYELGVKSTLFGRKLLLNATLFDQHFTNFQLNTFNGFVFTVSSVPDVYSKGVDADFVWLPIRNLSFQGGVTLADTRFGHGSQGALLAGNPQYLGAPGARLPLAPQYSSSISATYSHDLFEGYMGRINLGAKYSSSYDTGSDLDPGKTQKAFTVVDGRLTFGPKSEMWDVELWAENLFNQNYIQVAFDNGFQNAPTNGTGVLDAFLGNPRTFGVTLRGKF